MIRYIGVLLLTVLATISVAPRQYAQANVVRSVMLVGNDIVVRYGNGPIARLITDGAAKSLPVWSKDGEKIAFIEPAGRQVALAKLIVINKNGGRLVDLLVHPVMPGEVDSGMRFVEGIEWLTTDVVAVSGSVNPSTVEYDVFEVTSQKLISQFFDDGLGASFSPDGRHWVYVSGSPHFSAADARRPTLNVDGKLVFGDSGTAVRFTSMPQWSDDGTWVVVSADDASSGVQRLVLYHLGTPTGSTVSLPFSATTPPSVSWIDNDLYVQQSPSQSWVLRENGSHELWAPVNAKSQPNVKGAAEATRASLVRAAQAAGGLDADFWCESCDLMTLPRRSTRQ